MYNAWKFEKMAKLQNHQDSNGCYNYIKIVCVINNTYIKKKCTYCMKDWT